MRHARAKEKGTRRTIFMVSFVPTLIVVVFLISWRPLLLPYFFRYAKWVITEVINDKQRFLENELQFALKEWRLYELESRFGQEWCKENVRQRSDVTWLTLLCIINRFSFSFLCFKRGHLSYPMNPYALRTFAVGASCHVLTDLK